MRAGQIATLVLYNNCSSMAKVKSIKCLWLLAMTTLVVATYRHKWYNLLEIAGVEREIDVWTTKNQLKPREKTFYGKS
jgi:hypothetical protein